MRPKPVPLTPRQAACVQAIQSGARTLADVMAATGGSRFTTLEALSILEMRGVLGKVRDGRRHDYHLRGTLAEQEGQALFTIDPAAPVSDPWGPVQRSILDLMADGKTRSLSSIAQGIGKDAETTRRSLATLLADGRIGELVETGPRGTPLYRVRRRERQRPL